ncbi:unnamed protein product [Phaedon cochleariae]|uniref:DUF4806 domain-containing protein n=1 Tax=Phaedon cochleariae TaxID=80249 RepID=A0A9P0DHZ8_PHACE|nr:unnamed protein product [Phaedon cochleariae]
MDNSEKSWTIVQFDDLSVAAVPTNWIQGELCHWPSYLQTKLANAIRKCEPLNTCWPVHHIKIFRNATYDDYMTARNKSKVAEETSDLASDYENISKRRRVQKVLSSSDDSLTESILPVAPKLRLPTKNNAEIPQKEYHNTYIKESQTAEITPIIENNHLEVEVSDVPQRETERPNSSCVFCEKYFHTLLEQNHLLRSLTTDVLAEIRTLKKNTGPAIQEEIQSVFVKFAKEVKFPMQTDTDVKKLENILENPENFSRAVHEFAGFGGSNTYSFIKRVMSALMTNDMAKQYSWLGRKGKMSFHKLNLSTLLIRSAETAKISENFRQTELAIQSWLKRASERVLQENRQAKKF